MEVVKNFNIIVGKNLAAKRNELGCPQQRFCSEIGISLSAYKHYELGHRSVPIELLFKISDYYSMSIGDFFYDCSSDSSLKPKNPNKYKSNVRYKNILEEQNQKVESNLNISQKLKTIRNNRKKTQQEISVLLGIDISTYNKYEKGARKPNIEMLNKVAKIYNLSIEELIK